MVLRECLEKIIEQNFASGDYFDSHTVIDEILRNADYRIAYMQDFASNYKNCTIAQYHGFIAQEIAATKKAEVVTIDGNQIKIKTQTIYGDIEPNQLWKRI